MIGKGSMTPQKHKYFIEKENEIRFLDPVLGVELITDEPPPSLLADLLTTQGIEQLEKLANEQRLTVQLIQACHAGADDFHDMVRDSGNALQQATMVGVEMGWQSTFDKKGMSKISDLHCALSLYPPRRAFQEEQLSWLTKHNKLILPCEYPDNYESQLGTKFNDLVELHWETNKKGDKRKATILQGAYQTTRQWLFIAQLGYWLRQLENEGKLPTGQLKIPFMSGTHRSLE